MYDVVVLDAEGMCQEHSYATLEGAVQLLEAVEAALPTVLTVAVVLYAPTGCPVRVSVLSPVA